MERKIVTRKTIIKKPLKIRKTLNLNDFYEKRNKILITRAVGGLGDILMHRMMFENIKLLMPDCEIHFACPRIYHDAVSDHPFIDRLLGSEDIEPKEYIAHYNTTTACGRIEMQLAPLSAPHRTDIWSNHCGFNCSQYNMHIKFTDSEISEAKKVVSTLKDGDKPLVVFCPVSAMKNKNLLSNQTSFIVGYLKELGFSIIGLHHHSIEDLTKLNIPTAETANRTRLWMAILNEADYVIAVDTAAFHCAGGLEKPTLGVFSFVNGLVYGKYYPNIEILQGPCPLSYQGCYNWSLCPVDSSPKPCILGITEDMLKESINKLLERFPLSDK